MEVRENCEEKLAKGWKLLWNFELFLGFFYAVIFVSDLSFVFFCLQRVCAMILIIFSCTVKWIDASVIIEHPVFRRHVFNLKIDVNII